MSTANTSRRFGTDVSNIPSSNLAKTPKKSAVIKSTPATTTPTTNADESPSRTCFDALESLMDTIASEISLDDEITVKSPASKSASPIVDYFRYERDFLLGLQEACNEPLEGLIPEVTSSARNSDSLNMDNLSSNINRLNLSSVNASATAASTNKKSPRRQQSNAVPPVGSSERSIGSNSSVAPPSAVSLEWRAKRVKKEKPREHDSRRLAARQKQIDIGMNTVGYKRFTELVPQEQRTKSHPKIPDINQVCSKRSWDGQVRKWRRQLHDYDPNEAGQAADNAADGQEQNAAELHATGSDSEDEDFSENEEEDEQEEVVA